MENKYKRVEEWLRSLPATDNSFSDKNYISNASTWSAWEIEGKKIKSIENLLLQMLDNEDYDEYTQSIITALGYVGSENSYQALVLFARNNNPQIRMEAIGAIGNLKLNTAFSFLCRSIEDEDINVRANAYVAISKMHNQDAMLYLKKGLNDADGFVRLVVEKSIENLDKKKG